MRFVTSLALSVCTFTLVLVGLSGCSSIIDCNRDGCDAVSRPRTDYNINRGIAGAVAYESDVVGNGCQECGFSSTEFKIWETDMPVSDVTTAKSVIASSSPLFTFVANGKYEKVMSSGNYLVCAYSQCASVAITETGVITVNVMSTYGPSVLRVFESGSDKQRTEGIFDVHYVSY